MKSIWHLDLDSFFVSAERLRRPVLRDRPVAVGGDGVRGVIASCSYEARKFGVRSAMPTGRALKLCPNLYLCPPDFELYSKLSRQVFAILSDFTPLYETVSIDEAYLDMTGTEALFGKPVVAAQLLRKTIREKTGLTASIGISGNRLVSKITTDLCKPDNVLEVPHGTEAAFLAPHEVSRIPGCGKVTTQWLHEHGIETIGQLQQYPLDVLERHLGKQGAYLHEAAWGHGSTAFHEEAKTRTISRETTFEVDVADPEQLKKVIKTMSVDLSESLRKEGVFARAIRLKLRYPPFETVTRSRVLATPTQFSRPLCDAVAELFEENWNQSLPLRLIGIGFVLGEKERQLGLFEDLEGERRHEKIDHLKDALKKKFGEKVIL